MKLGLSITLTFNIIFHFVFDIFEGKCVCVWGGGGFKKLEARGLVNRGLLETGLIKLRKRLINSFTVLQY